MILSIGTCSGKKACQAVIGPGGRDDEDFSAEHLLDDEGVSVHSLLELRKCDVVGQDSTAHLVLKTAGQEEHFSIESASQPFVVTSHELAGLRPIRGEPQQN